MQAEEVMRDLLKQLLLALDVLYKANITHRDIKPENLLIRPRAAKPPFLDLRLIDFGSAVDPYSIRNLYGPSGPSAEQETPEYAPPEALLGGYARSSGSPSALAPSVFPSGELTPCLPSPANIHAHKGACARARTHTHTPHTHRHTYTHAHNCGFTWLCRFCWKDIM